MRATINISNLSPFEFRVHDDADIFVSDQILKHGIWEPCETELFCRLIRPGNTVLDIGANIGYYTSIASRLIGEAGKVFAFEPEPRNFGVLDWNARNSEFDNIVAINQAVADYVGECSLHISPENLGHHSVLESIEHNAIEAVSVTSLDDYFADNLPKTNFVKIDVEGGEQKVLEGMKDIMALNCAHLIVVMEFWPIGLNEAPGGLSKMLETMRSSFEYYMVVREEEMSISEVSFDEIVEIGKTGIVNDPDVLVNFVCFTSRDSFEAAKQSF
jgi:FkbM family methyltransferase